MTKKNKTRTIYGLLFLLLVIAVVSIVGYVKSRKSDEKPDTDTQILAEVKDEATRKRMKAAALSKLGSGTYVAST